MFIVLFARDKQSIIQYKGVFDSIATYIESDNGKEQVEGFREEALTE